MPIVESRLLLMSQPAAAACRRLETQLERCGLKARLGADLFQPSNWHQSLSDVFEDEPLIEQQLRAAGALLGSSRAVRLMIDRVESRQGPAGVQWAFYSEQTPKDFKALRQSVRSAIQATTGRTSDQPTAHLTISYRAPEHLKRMVLIEPVEWTLDEVLLVRGGGRPYHYEIIDRWKLQPARVEQGITQAPLF